MFRQMRREKQQLSEEKIRKILDRNTSGVLSLLDENGYTYGVPMSYVLLNDKLYFHSAAEGAKLNAVRFHNKVSFTIIDQDEVMWDELNTKYRSVIVFGQVRIVTDQTEKDEAVRALGRRYASEMQEEELESYIAKHPNVEMIALDIEHMTGKKSSI